MEVGTKVMTPLGIAYLDGADPERGALLVRYSKQDYRDTWKLISPGNGPCVYKMLSVDEVTGIIKDGNVVPVYRNKRSGRRYLLLGTTGDKRHIKSIDTGFAWWTTRHSLETRFEKEVLSEA